MITEQMITSGAAAQMELGRQVLVSLGYPALTRSSVREFRSSVSRLRPGLDTIEHPVEEPHRVPFVLVVSGVGPAYAMPLTHQGDLAGYVDMRPVDPTDFAAVDVEIPAAPYLLLDVDTGRDTLGVAPRDALPVLTRNGRIPLTIAEGIALITLFPGILRTANCFQMLASRRGDKRVPSLWVTKAGAPRLGWCFEGVPHSWLGAASCAARSW